jgi:signal-transduction protein with cAMP-binding, CBS, and nucleotidyltransferase domain
MKTLIEKAFFLKKIDPFAELDLETLLAIADKLHEDEYDPKEQIFSPGKVANRLYLIVKGAVQIQNQNLQNLIQLYHYDFFGEESLFNQHPRSYFATCITESLFFTLSKSHLRSIISECPSVSIALLQRYTTQHPCRFELS